MIKIHTILNLSYLGLSASSMPLGAYLRRMPFLLGPSPSDTCLFGGGGVLDDPQLYSCPADVVSKDVPILCSRQVASGSVVQDWNSQMPSWSWRANSSPAASASAAPALFSCIM